MYYRSTYIYIAGAHISTIVVYLEFTSRSSDYILSKAGWFSTKLSLTSVPEIQDNTIQSHHFFSSFFHSHAMDFHACDKRVKVYIYMHIAWATGIGTIFLAASFTVTRWISMHAIKGLRYIYMHIAWATGIGKQVTHTRTEKIDGMIYIYMVPKVKVMYYQA